MNNNGSFKDEANLKQNRSPKTIENIPIMQGGGYLGAFSCGVYKALAERKVRIDIAAGTSIGAVNTAIIAGSKSDHPERS